MSGGTPSGVDTEIAESVILRYGPWWDIWYDTGGWHAAHHRTHRVLHDPSIAGLAAKLGAEDLAAARTLRATHPGWSISPNGDGTWWHARPGPGAAPATTPFPGAATAEGLAGQLTGPPEGGKSRPPHDARSGGGRDTRR